MRRDPHDEIQVTVTRPVAAAATLPGQPDPLAVRHPGWDRDVEGPASAVAAGQRDGPAAAVVGLLDGELDLGFLVGARDRPKAPPGPEPAATAAEDTAQKIVNVDVAAAAEAAAVEVEPAGPGAATGPAASASGASSAPPGCAATSPGLVLGNLAEVAPEGVVTAPRLRIGEDVVGLRDFLEPVLRPGSWLMSG